MSETVKLIIEIPVETYEYWKTHRDEYILAEAIVKDIRFETVEICGERAIEASVFVGRK